MFFFLEHARIMGWVFSRPITKIQYRGLAARAMGKIKR